MSKCQGCGATIQVTNQELSGFAKDINSNFCLRCFRIKNYNDYQKVSTDGREYLDIVSSISNTNDLVLVLVDLLSIPESLNELFKMLKNPIILVLTKRDLLPKVLYEERIIDYFRNISDNIMDTVVISANKNYHIDELYDMILDYKNSDRVYVVGYTNAGKSTLINKMIKNYTSLEPTIVTSMLPSTTLDSMEIEFDESLTIVDTPGLLDKGNILEFVSGNDIKVITPNSEIKPMSYQLNKPQSFMIGEYARVDVKSPVTVIFYCSNKLNLVKVKNDNMKDKSLKSIHLKEREDLVINGLCFIKFMGDTQVDIYTHECVEVYKRKSLI